MHDIDFLPAEYRRNLTRRRQQTWHVIGGGALLAVLVAAALAQFAELNRLRGAKSELEPYYQAVLTRGEQLERLQAEQRPIEAQAELVAYLSHPWPTTQVLAALAAPLPEEIAFHQVQMSGKEAAGARRSQGGDAAAEEKGTDAAAADLARLRREFDGRPVAVEITGFAADNQTLHTYIQRLGKNDLFTAVELRSMEAQAEGPRPAVRFVVGLQLRPGYGQTGGPGPPPPEGAVASLHR